MPRKSTLIVGMCTFEDCSMRFVSWLVAIEIDVFLGYELFYQKC